MDRATFAQRARDLVQQMTLAEKVGQLMSDAPAIERLGVPRYHWWNECLHGVGRAGVATVFPQAIGLAATWNGALVGEVASVISDEARAKHHEAVRQGETGIYTGLTMWAPNINIFRDPRWGRGQETYGEDPVLTACLAIAYVRGLQGDDSVYLKVVATPKHFAVHSGPEATRAGFDVHPDSRDLWETYLPAFEACVREGKAASVMGAYNRLDGVPCCANPWLLNTLLREQWGFDGVVVSDCGAIFNIHQHHRTVETAAEAAALAVLAGCDVECGGTYGALVEAVERGLIDEATIDRAVERAFEARFRLGMFDPPEAVPYAQIPITVNDSPAHRALALRAAEESLVLLKNADSLLPLSKSLRKIAVVGPNADAPDVLLGNYNGTPSASVTPLAGIRARAAVDCEVVYVQGCRLATGTSAEAQAALAQAQDADVIVFVGGLSQALEGEEGQQEGVPEGLMSQGDRLQIELPAAQDELLRALCATGIPVVLVLLNGSAIAIPWAAAHLGAILEAWYPGEEGGTAIAAALFGDINPGGKLPVTFYAATSDLPPFEDYRMQGRTYRYYEHEPLFPFGHGLSYTKFAYNRFTRSAERVRAGETLYVSVEVGNSGERAGDEVVQLYSRQVSAGTSRPLKELRGFARVHLQAGEQTTVRFELPVNLFASVSATGDLFVVPGEVDLMVGSSSADLPLCETIIIDEPATPVQRVFFQHGDAHENPHRKPLG